jgi:hypothetical protein
MTVVSVVAEVLSPARRAQVLGSSYRRSVHQENREQRMAQIPPFHSKKPGAMPVHHDNDKCIEIANIEAKDRIAGTGGRPRCSRCSRLA